MWVLVILFVLAMIGSSKEKTEKENAAKEALRRRKEAEDYIMNSGDKEAIKMLMLARANPANYGQVLSGGMNTGNNTLKTAMGVMAGVAVGSLVANAVTASAISSALENAQAELAKAEVDVIADVSADTSSWSDDLFG